MKTKTNQAFIHLFALLLLNSCAAGGALQSKWDTEQRYWGIANKQIAEECAKYLDGKSTMRIQNGKHSEFGLCEKTIAENVVFPNSLYPDVTFERIRDLYLTRQMMDKGKFSNNESYFQALDGVEKKYANSVNERASSEMQESVASTRALLGALAAGTQTYSPATGSANTAPSVVRGNPNALSCVSSKVADSIYTNCY